LKTHAQGNVGVYLGCVVI